MADQIKELIEKIQKEGVQAAQEKAQEIEGQARQKAELILKQAHAQAQKIIEEAQGKVARMQESSQASLKQAGRDLLLVLKKEIVEMLQKLIVKDISSGLSAEELAKIITLIIKEYSGKENKEVVLYLSEHDKKKLEEHFLHKLKSELKNGIELKAQGEIHSGFMISFDAGKSHFDFTNNALAGYISSYLKPKVAELLKGSD